VQLFYIVKLKENGGDEMKRNGICAAGGVWGGERCVQGLVGKTEGK